MFAHLNATTVLSRSISEKGIYPAVDPLDSTSTILKPDIVGEEHYRVANAVKEILQRYKELQDIIAILGIDELSDEDKLVVAARGASRALPVAAVPRRGGSSPARPGEYVPIAETIRGFNEILEGKHDEIPESLLPAQGHDRRRRRGGEGRQPLMAKTTFTVEVLTPEGEVFNDEVEMVSTRTTVGLDRHPRQSQPLLGDARPDGAAALQERVGGRALRAGRGLRAGRATTAR